MLTPTIAGIALIALLAFLAVSLRALVLVSPLLGAGAVLYWRVVRAERAAFAELRPVLVLAFGGPLLGIAFARLAGLTGHGWFDWGAPILSGMVAAGLAGLLSGGAKLCQLCKAPLGGPSLTCPRCHDTVCTRPSCWNARYSRCRRCQEREILVLPVQEAWWTLRLGPRARQGECTHCYKEAHEADLRECGKCHWPMCQRCWDYHNGVCHRCQWVIPNLPAELAVLVGQTTSAAEGPAQARGPARVTRRPPVAGPDAPPPPAAAPRRQPPPSSRRQMPR